MGADSVSGTLSSIPSYNPQDDFDVFAQTRTGTLPQQHKNSTKVEDTQVPAGDIRSQRAEGRRLKGGNADMEPIDSWLITQGMIPVAQSSVMDDIEEWLCADVKGDEAEGVTSEEFDKFLEERAKAAEMMPSLPTPSAGDPAPPAHMTGGGRKKTGVHEDTLFAV